MKSLLGLGWKNPSYYDQNVSAIDVAVSAA